MLSSGNSPATCRGYKSALRWVEKALREQGKRLSDLVDGDQEPASELAASVHNRIATWFCQDKTMDFFRTGGIAACRRTLPKDCLSKARNFMYTYINSVRAKVGKPSLPIEWGRQLAGQKLDVKKVTEHAVDKEKKSGSIFHHKKDFAPPWDMLVMMCRCGWEATSKVHGNTLDALEAGMAISVYLLTGARGSELKKMVLQDLGDTKHQDTRAGEEFFGLRLMAHLTKTMVLHLNELMCHSHPWMCAVGLIGLSILLRMKQKRTHPSFKLGVDDNTWHLFGTKTTTIDARINEVYKCTASACEDGEDADTQRGYPVTYLGRHRGTILLQDEGGSKDGGEARTGHFSSGTAHPNYSGMPAPDRQRLTGTNPDNPRLAAHLRQDRTQAAADKALIKHVPGYSAIKAEFGAVKARMEYIRKTYSTDRAKAMRTDEQLCTRRRYLRSLILVCQTAVCCIVARPRTWKRWVIDQSAQSLWEMRCPTSRAVWELFDLGSVPECPEMDELAAVVRELEEEEIRSPLSDGATAQAIKDTQTAERLRMERIVAEERAQCSAKLRALHMEYQAFFQPMLVLPADRERFAAFCASSPVLSTAPPSPAPKTPRPALDDLLTEQKTKRQKVFQDPEDPASVKSIFDHIKEAKECGEQAGWVQRALDYAVNDLAVRERKEGPKWRTSVKVRSNNYKNHVLIVSEFARFKSTGMDDAAAQKAMDDAMAANRYSVAPYLKSLKCDPVLAGEIMGVHITMGN